MSPAAARAKPQTTLSLTSLAISLDRLEVALGGDREAGLDHVDAHGLEHLGDPELLGDGHRAARRLLAVAQGGVEDDDALGLSGRPAGTLFGGHCSDLMLLVKEIGRRQTPERVRNRRWLRGS